MNGNWVSIFPVLNLEIDKTFNREFKVLDVTLIDPKKLPFVWKKIGLPAKVSTLKKSNEYKMFFRDIKGLPLAFVRRSGEQDATYRASQKIIRDELFILAGSQLLMPQRPFPKVHYIPNARRFKAVPQIPGSLPYGFTMSCCLNTINKQAHFSTGIIGKKGVLTLDHEWKYFQKKKWLFLGLVRYFQKKRGSRCWRDSLRSALVLVGKSQTSNEVPDAFLWNMIVIEILLTNENDKYSDALPKRVEAFLGWADAYHHENIDQRIKEVYKKRCKLVHTGRAEDISVDDLLFTDNLVFCLFSNIVSHYDIFDNKEKIIQFSNQVQAEKTLGIPSKVRPKSLDIQWPAYNGRDRKII